MVSVFRFSSGPLISFYLNQLVVLSGVKCVCSCIDFSPFSHLDDLYRSVLLVCNRLLGELQSEGTLTAEQSLRVKEWLCSVEEERSGLTTASGPDSGIENSSTEDSVALRRARPSIRNQVRFFQMDFSHRSLTYG